MKIDQQNSATLWGLLILLAGLALQLLYPGNVPWINDEPRLFLRALSHNSTGTLAIAGLTGTSGMPYGPIPTWFYQVALLLTHNPVHVVLAKTLLFWLVTLYFSFKVCRQLNLRVITCAFLLLSPYLYFYQRSLWDNPFIIPVSAVFIFLTTKLLDKPKVIDLYFLSLTTAVLLQIHLMTIFLIVAVVLTILIYKRTFVKSNLISCILSVLLLLALSSQYLWVLLPFAHSSGAQDTAASSNFFKVLSFFDLYSFRVFPDYFFPALTTSGNPNENIAISILQILTLISAVFFLGGVAIFTLKKFRDSLSVLQVQFAFFSAATIVIQSIYHLIRAKEMHPHYYLPSWFAVFFFIALFASRFWQVKSIRRAIAIQMVSSTALLIILVLKIDHFSGNRTLAYGPTLKNQIKIIEEYSSYKPDTLVTPKVHNYQLFPHAFQALSKLLGSSGERKLQEDERLAIKYSYPENKLSGEIMLKVE